MKTIVTGALQATAEELNMLRGLGLEITLHQDEKQQVEHPEQFEAALCNGLFLYNDISAFTNLKYIQLTSAGMDRIPMDYIRSHGIEVHNAAGVYSVPMAEWTIMRILDLYKNAARQYENQQNRQWVKDRSWQELDGKSACIVGFGAYGMETAKRLKAFGVQVSVVNRTQKESDWVDEYYPLDKLEDALRQADIVILAIALTESTRNLMGPAQFAAMKPGAIFLNAARGGLVDEDALLEALQNGRLSGAALDVFQVEPLPENSSIWTAPNVTVTPHNSFVSNKNHLRLLKQTVRNLESYVEKQKG